MAFAHANKTEQKLLNFERLKMLDGWGNSASLNG